MQLSRRLRIVLFALTVSAASAAPFERLYVFGDSFSDFGAGYVDCDGPPAVAYFAWQLGLEFTHAKAQGAAGKSIDFAVSGAQTGEGAGRQVKDALLSYGMANQVRDFAARVKAGELRFEPDRTLFFIAGGLNDRMLATEVTIANLREQIETLTALGARHITLALLPTRIPNYSAVGNRLNPAFAQLVETVRQKDGLDISLNRWGAYFDEVMDHPANYGIVNTTTKCAGRGIYDEDVTPVGDPATYFYYHNNHPSTAVHRVVGRKLYEEFSARAMPPAPAAKP